MFDKTHIHTGGPSHVAHEHKLAPTAEHLRLLKEYREQAVEEAKAQWFAGNLTNIGFGKIHARRYRHEAFKRDAVEVSFNVAGHLHQLTIQVDDDVVRLSPDPTGVLVDQTRKQLAAYLVEHVLLYDVLHSAISGS